MRWCLSNRADPDARRLADRHYNRQKPGTEQFVPPGRSLVLISTCSRALWITSWPFPKYVKHRWGGAWICSAFRSEGAGRASELIREAVAATIDFFGVIPPEGLVSFIDKSHVRPIPVHSTPTWGWTWKKAGFVPAGETAGGLLAFQLLPAAMPTAEPALPKPGLEEPYEDILMPDLADPSLTASLESLEPAALLVRYQLLRDSIEGKADEDISDDTLRELIAICGIMRRRSVGPPKPAKAAAKIIPSLDSL